MAIFVLFLLIIQITASITWMTNFEITNLLAGVGVFLIVVNIFLIVGLFLHKKCIIIGWLWLHGFLLVTGAVLDYPHIPISMIVITASCFLAVFVLLQTFDHHIRIEVLYNNSLGTQNPARGNSAHQNPENNRMAMGKTIFSFFINYSERSERSE